MFKIGITSHHKISESEWEQLSMFDKLANMAKTMYKAERAKIMSYVLAWDGLVTTYHSIYVKELNLSPSIEAYIQSRVIKKTLENISLNYRRGDEKGGRCIDEMDDVMTKLLPARVDGLTCLEYKKMRDKKQLINKNHF